MNMKKASNIKLIMFLILLIFLSLGVFYFFKTVTIGEKITIEYQKTTVVSIKRKPPKNVHEEINLWYEIELSNGNKFVSSHRYLVGDTVYYEIYKINK